MVATFPEVGCFGFHFSLLPCALMANLSSLHVWCFYFQGMKATYVVKIDNVDYGYFDKVEELRDFGAVNNESIGFLLWAFFDYWAYCHDYANDVISVRTAGIIR